MERIKKARGIIRSAFLRLHDKVTADLNFEDPDRKEVQANLLLLGRKVNELLELDKAIIEQMLDEDGSEADFEQEMAAADEYQRKYERLRIDVRNVTAVTCDDIKSVHSAQGTRRKFKLPKIELKKFGGDIKEWLPFWSQFRKIDEDDEIAAEDKFQYLIQVTVEGSRARELVNSFPPTEENYAKAVEGLKSRFGREDMLVEVYVRELLTLVLKKVVDKNEQMSLCSLYDKLESQLRALESLGVTSDKYAAMLFPLVESSMPEELLRTWQRTSTASENNLQFRSVESSETLTGIRLKNLMSFLRSEVENEERIKLASSGFSLTNETKTRQKKMQSFKEDVPTAAGLINIKDVKPNNNNCIFCEKRHNSAECFMAKKMTLDEKRKMVDMSLMSPKLPGYQETGASQAKNEASDNTRVDTTLANHSTLPEVFLQTLVVKMKCNDKVRFVRAIIDIGSQRSYILDTTAENMGYPCVGKEPLIHSLFGGMKTVQQEHKRYRIRLSSLNDEYACQFDALNQKIIVDDITHIKGGKWMTELNALNIKLSDTGNVKGPIEVLIGADIAGKLFTGERKELNCGLVAMKTRLGWTLLGKIPFEEKTERCVAMNVISMIVRDAKVCDLWDLHILGIKDPTEIKLKQEKDIEVKELFEKTVTINEDDRYEIQLPWIDNKPEFPSNFEIAEKRLQTVTRKLKAESYFNEYDSVLKEWLQDGVIEVVSTDDGKEVGHYLPHRHVVKENSTTRVRPVFDASARQKNWPSLNQCLEKGPNMIELIPAILLRFRMNKIGVTADIKRAFLQISVCESDRNYLRFLWWNENNELVVYRHTRVVFGVISSPFLLAPVIDFHLRAVLNNINENNRGDLLYSKEIIEKLLNSFYVDNCVTSVRNCEELERFMRESRSVMSCAKFDLRGWEHSWLYDTNESNEVSLVLGLKWNKRTDTLQINTDFLKYLDVKCITKRLILSVAHRLFDPIGFLSPITLFSKLLLQQAWSTHLSWDTEVNEEIRIAFLGWLKDLPFLLEARIPRWLFGIADEGKIYSIHTFCDSSKVAYAAAIFIRVESSTGVTVQLVQAKSRVAPLKRLTIPRLELMAATIGARLTTDVTKNLKGIEEFAIIYWSDSTTVLAWIKRDEQWQTFVRNRIQEIRQQTNPESWRHIHGENNPADLPSRGCGVRKLLQLQWLEGPAWLKCSPQEWPESNFISDETEIIRERKKIATATINNTSNTSKIDWYYNYFDSYRKVVRVVAWVKRFVSNCLNQAASIKSHFTVEELENAEKQIIKFIQAEVFVEKARHLSSLNAFMDTEGVLRIKTKLTLRKDTENFRYPVVLPDRHPVVTLIIKDRHEKTEHAGVQILLNILREDYWIVRGRKTVRSVLKKCIVCKRYEAKRLEAVPCALPKDRVKDAAVFEIVGIDYSGPVYLKGNNKAWICLFTCGVYRAVHLELTTSLSTQVFIQALRRFVARRGRPATIYSDNGTNFVGAENTLMALDWGKIEEYATAQKIQWKFNPPSAAWWGGWWERLIRVMKNLLRRTLGRARLSYEEMITVLYDCESIINSRPITYLSDSDTSILPLSPNMFIQEVKEIGVPDLDTIDSKSLNKRLQYIRKLRLDLRNRFRSEYLGQLLQKVNQHNKNARPRIVGEIVLIGSDDTKRIDWPLAKVIEIIPGKDGGSRLARLRTAKGELLRPVQRIYPLEVTCEDREHLTGVKLPTGSRKKEVKIKKREENLPAITRTGRVVKKPLKLLE